MAISYAPRLSNAAAPRHGFPREAFCSPRLMACHRRRSRLPQGDRPRAARQNASSCALRRQPCALRPRRLPTADVAPDRRRLIDNENMQCSATALSRRFCVCNQWLEFCAVELRFDSSSTIGLSNQLILLIFQLCVVRCSAKTRFVLQPGFVSDSKDSHFSTRIARNGRLALHWTRAG